MYSSPYIYTVYSESSVAWLTYCFCVFYRYLTHDYIIVYLDPDHGVYINTNQGYAIRKWKHYL